MEIMFKDYRNGQVQLLVNFSNQAIWLRLSVLWCLFMLSLLSPSLAFAQSVETQRKDYLAAKVALDNRQYKTFSRLSASLKDYPLYPYLRYDYLRKRLGQVGDDKISEFLQQYPDLPVSNRLRVAWLRLLMKRTHFKTFLEHYTAQTDLELQCYQLQARIKTANDTLLLEDIRSLWLAGESLPPSCDPAFALLYQSDLMTNDLVWQRIRLAMQNNKQSLVRFLSKRLDPKHQKLANQWLQIVQNPEHYIAESKFADDTIGREILLDGLARLAKKDVTKAVKRFAALKQDYTFVAPELTPIKRTLALLAAKRNSPLRTRLLDEIDHGEVDEEIFHYRLQTALAVKDWGLLKKWTAGSVTVPKLDLRWRYWQARALAETGNTDKAIVIYTALAKERDYYGFLAADKVSLPYSMNHFSLPEDKQTIKKLKLSPALQRVYEFEQLNMKYAANREWNHALRKMTSYHIQLTAVIASQWGWHERVIFSLGRARAYDDLKLRFPILFKSLLEQYAQTNNIDLAWMYAIVRAESAFIEDIRSPAGALGLMQVMPNTGKMIAKNIGLRHFKTSKLKQAKVNIPIGSAYMRQMLNKFDGNILLATVAYNAGPHRVSKWISKKECLLADVWVEQIPFNETRKYVRRVLSYANIYDWRLKTTIKPIKKRMVFIDPNRQNKHCAKMTISENQYVH